MGLNEKFLCDLISVDWASNDHFFHWKLNAQFGVEGTQPNKFICSQCLC